MGGEQRTPMSAYSCGIRCEDSVDQYGIKFTYDYKEAALSLLTGAGTDLLEVGDILR
jgi:hypothetical protein